MAASGMSVGELKAQYPLLCKAMRVLVREGVTINQARRTVCWQHLALLHRSLPRQYRDPELLFLYLRREPVGGVPQSSLAIAADVIWGRTPGVQHRWASP
jgi:hypothetical protein